MTQQYAELKKFFWCACRQQAHPEAKEHLVEELDPAGVAGFCFAMMALIVLLVVVKDAILHFLVG
ncbi:MAG TPA: hypothetical protein PLY96_08100 [Chromatiaceae bacterium]|nr:hypothetical protein [Chromatiaceae bacterium]